jgi:FixJ family two-component response regulator
MAASLIAVIDDDPSVCRSLSSLLRSVGFGVEVFGTAEEFVASDRLGKTECVILDVRMPGMGGLELQRRLALSQPKLPVVFITAHCADEDVRSRTLKDGAVAYLSKPLSEEAVLSAVEAALKTKGRGGHE